MEARGDRRLLHRRAKVSCEMKIVKSPEIRLNARNAIKLWKECEPQLNIQSHAQRDVARHRPLFVCSSILRSTSTFSELQV